MNRNKIIYQTIRANYQAKRKSEKWIKRKGLHKKERLFEIQRYYDKIKKGVKNLKAPKNFSFVDNPQNVLIYFNQITEFVCDNQPVNIDIREIENLTPDTIILLIAKLSDKKSKRVGLSGNAPKEPLLHRMFLESGLYNFVRSRGAKPVAPNNKLWKHSTNNQVKGEMAGQATEICKIMFAKNNVVYDTDNLYNLLVEAMSNTINHADNNKYQVNWWLYYFIDEVNEKIKYSFIDLGIGIFKSASFNSYRKLFNIFLKGNAFLVKPFLEGKIISSRINDSEISGKGVKQIISCAILPEFINFTIITNDIKINVKTKASESLNTNFDGTLIYFEISYKK